jgi:short-subunit dehydrogenase
VVIHEYFKNKVVWITGATSGIGLALAVRLSKISGIKIILSARSHDKLERIAQELSNNGAELLVLPIDLADYSKAPQWVEAVINTFGTVDILINNGGISQRSWAIETPLDIDKMLFEVNFFGTVALTKQVLPVMIKQKRGHIIVVSSIAGKFGFYLRSSYSASKHALHGFFDSLRLELEPYSIAVTLVCPGKVKTNISLNALTASGLAHGKMDEATSKGISADSCAKKIIEATAKQKQEVYIGGKEIIPVYIKRFFPSLLNNILRKQKIE